jgi:RNA polymerase sigma-70 factor, ECF subfamily
MAVIHASAAELTGVPLSADQALEHEFETRLADSSTLAFRVAYSVLRHHQDAEDVAQEAFIRAHRGFRRLRDRERFRAWLVRMTWRLALDKRRGDGRRAARESAVSIAGAGSTSEDDVIAQDRARRLWQAIDRLPEKLRIALVLSAIEGHGVREIAALLGIPEGTVKSRLFDARKRLQELLTCMNPSTTR